MAGASTIAADEPRRRRPASAAFKSCCSVAQTDRGDSIRALNDAILSSSVGAGEIRKSNSIGRRRRQQRAKSRPAGRTAAGAKFMIHWPLFWPLGARCAICCPEFAPNLLRPKSESDWQFVRSFRPWKKRRAAGSLLSRRTCSQKCGSSDEWLRMLSRESACQRAIVSRAQIKDNTCLASLIENATFARLGRAQLSRNRTKTDTNQLNPFAQVST